MTREEAITVLNMVEAHGLADKAKHIAIEALEFDLDKHDEEVIKNTVETLWGEPYEDCISREAAIKVFGDVHPMDYNTQAYITNIQNLPPVTPQPKMGRWIPRSHVFGVAYCSECDFELKIDDTNYCPNCGAKMESEEV